jgi:heme exporter protein A
MLIGRDLAAFRGERLVFRDLRFDAAPGSALTLLGPNGAGKSTLLRLIAGLVRAEAGSLIWGDQDVLGDTVAQARLVAYLGHQDAVKPGLTPLENLAFPARLSGRDPHAALAAVGLTPLAELPARFLSAGQKRRLALARLTLSTAPVWLLDEPTLGLDVDAVAGFGRLLATHRAAGGIVLAATHLPLPLPDAGTLRLG